jgi:hypothetical protein
MGRVWRVLLYGMSRMMNLLVVAAPIESGLLLQRMSLVSKKGAKLSFYFLLMRHVSRLCMLLPRRLWLKLLQALQLLRMRLQLAKEGILLLSQLML